MANMIPDVRRLLGELGPSADAVAITLLAHNIRGVRNSARFLNPIVRYLQTRLLDETIRLDVTHGDRVRVYMPKKTVTYVALPPPVADFLAAFHAGLYPSLELPPEPAP